MQNILTLFNRFRKLNKSCSGFVYAFKCHGLANRNGTLLHVFKVGQSSRKKLDRLSEFPGPSKCKELLSLSFVPEKAIKSEQHILKYLKKANGVIHLNEFGREYFGCRSTEKFRSHLSRAMSKINHSPVYPPLRRSTRIADRSCSAASQSSR
jgi:hypothetical protein